MKLDGNYDDESEQALVDVQGDAVLLIVLNGKRGTGFSVSARDLRAIEGIPGVLRNVANSIEEQMRQGPPQTVKVKAVPRR